MRMYCDSEIDADMLAANWFLFSLSLPKQSRPARRHVRLRTSMYTTCMYAAERLVATDRRGKPMAGG